MLNSMKFMLSIIGQFLFHIIYILCVCHLMAQSFILLITVINIVIVMLVVLLKGSKRVFICIFI